VAKERASDFMTTKVKRKEAKDRTVKKAVKSKGEFEPKQKHVRAAILECWKENGCVGFLEQLVAEPIDADAVVGFKGMTLVHKVLHEGPSSCLQDCFHRVNMFKSLRKNWEHRYRDGYSDCLKVYISFLVNKISFHHRHPAFPGSLSYEEYLKQRTVARYEDRTEIVNVVGELLDLQGQILDVKNQILRNVGAQVLPAKLAALIPLVVESYNIYTLSVGFLHNLCEQLDDLEPVQFLLERFYGQYFDIRSFYDDCHNIAFVIAIITVPLLPPEPPQFAAARRRVVPKPKAKPKAKPKPKPQPVVQEPTVEQMSMLIQQQTPAPRPAPVVHPTPAPQQAAHVHQAPAPVQQSWITFDENSAAGQQPSQASLSAAGGGENAFAFTKVAMQQTRAAAVEAPAPAPAPEPAPGPDERDAQIKDLKRRLLGLQKLFKLEREKRLHAESAVEDRDTKIAKWKDAYENLLKKNEGLKREHCEAEERAEELEQKLVALEQAREEDSRMQLRYETAEVARAIKVGLVRLDSPTHSGRANASPAEVSDAVSVLLQAITALQEARTPQERSSAIRRIGAAVTEILDVIKGVASLTEDPAIRQMLFDAGRSIARSVAGLLRGYHANPEDLTGLASDRVSVEAEIAKLDGALRALMSEGEEKPDEEVDFDKFANDATRELMRAVEVIENAAKRLENARHTRAPAQNAVHANISEAITDAALAIAGATAALVKNAKSVQEENAAKGRAGNKGKVFYKRDCVWIEGLISAARNVAGGTSNLVQAASDAAEGKADEETLIAASQEVSSATAQLVCAARVRSDPNSPAQGKLEDASKAVSAATHHLVEAAKRARSEKEEEDTTDYLDMAPMKKMLAVQEAKANMLRLQNQLEQAQRHLAKLHSSSYDKPPSTTATATATITATATPTAGGFDPRSPNGQPPPVSRANRGRGALPTPPS